MTIVFYFFSVLLAFLYIFVITHILTAWQEIEEWEVSPGFRPDTKVSVVVPFRNEEGTLGQCLQSVLRATYPKKNLQIIAVDDHSNDRSLDRIPDAIEVISNEGSGKKEAIRQALRMAKGDLIVTLDADCIVNTDWLISLTSYYEYTDKRMIVGMVSLEAKENVLEYFQVMDTCGVMGLHGAGIHNKTHFLANGANLAFEKSLYDELMPYEDNLDVASGDDVFFVDKVGRKHTQSIGFLKSKSSVVSTSAENTWSSLWQQRKRWASKNNRFSRGIYKAIPATIWLLSCSIILNILLIPLTAGLSLFVLLMQVLIKGAMDFLYLQNMTAYFKKQAVLKYFIPALLIQTFYIFIAGLWAMGGGSYTWKGRKTK